MKMAQLKLNNLDRVWANTLAFVHGHRNKILIDYLHHLQVPRLRGAKAT